MSSNPSSVKRLSQMYQLIRFSDSLVENRRTGFTGAILDDYLKFMKHERKEVDGFITTAKPLSAQELEKVKVKTIYKSEYFILMLNSRLISSRTTSLKELSSI